MIILGTKIESLRIQNIGGWPERIRKIVIATAGILTIFLGYLLDIRQQIEEISSSTKKVQLSSTEYFDNFREASNLDSYKKDILRVEDQLKKLTKLLPSTNEEAETLEDITQQVEDNGLKFVAVKPGNPSSTEYYDVDPMEFTLSGSYNALGQFVSNIAGMQRIVTLHDFTVSVNKSDPGLTMVVSARTYWTSKLGKKP